MYDTLHFWLDRALLNNNPFQVALNLSNAVESSSNRGYYIKGGIDNFRVSVSESGISVQGSLSKFYFGNNIQTLSLQQTFEAIQMLSDRLQVSLFEAKVTRIDFGTVLITNKSPETYFKYLGNKRYFERVQKTKHSLTYETKKRVLSFYDKSLEAKKNKISIPEQFKDKNLLRYELRFLNTVCTQLNEKEITGATLCKQAFYLKLVQLWKDEYTSIEKINTNNKIDYSRISTPKDAKDELLKSLLLEKDITCINSFVKDLKANSVFKYAKDYTRLQNDIKSFLNNSSNKYNLFEMELNELILSSCYICIL